MNHGRHLKGSRHRLRFGFAWVYGRWLAVSVAFPVGVWLGRRWF